MDRARVTALLSRLGIRLSYWLRVGKWALVAWTAIGLCALLSGLYSPIARNIFGAVFFLGPVATLGYQMRGSNLEDRIILGGAGIVILPVLLLILLLTLKVSFAH